MYSLNPVIKQVFSSSTWVFRFFSRIAVNFSFKDFSLIAYKVKVPYWKQEFNLSLVDALN